MKLLPAAAVVGVLLTDGEVQRAADLCKAAGCWLIMDNTYEQFVYNGRQHMAVSGDHILHMFSFSKAYGMMGWRVGYIAYPEGAAGGQLGAEMLKVRDGDATQWWCVCVGGGGG